MITITFEQAMIWLKNNGHWNHFRAELRRLTPEVQPEERFAQAGEMAEAFDFGKESIYGEIYWDDVKRDFNNWRSRFKDDSRLAKMLRYMEEGGSVSYLNSESEFGIKRLTARICELRTRGHVILSETFRDKEGNRHTRYYMEGKK